MRSNRPTIDLVLLLIAGTVCFVVLASTIVVLIKQFTDPEGPTGFSAIADVVNTLISLLAGFLAGRSESTIRQVSRPPEDEK